MNHGCCQSFKDLYSWRTVPLEMIILHWHWFRGGRVFEQAPGKIELVRFDFFFIQQNQIDVCLGTSAVESMRTDMWQTMSKPNKFCRLVNIKWHSSKFVDRFRSIGVNRAINIGHHQKSIEVKHLLLFACKKHEKKKLFCQHKRSSMVCFRLNFRLR